MIPRSRWRSRMTAWRFIDRSDQR